VEKEQGNLSSFPALAVRAKGRITVKRQIFTHLLTPLNKPLTKNCTLLYRALTYEVNKQPFRMDDMVNLKAKFQSSQTKESPYLAHSLSGASLCL